MSISKKDRLRTTILEPVSDVLIFKHEGREIRVYFAMIAPLVAARLTDEDSGVNRQNRDMNATQFERIASSMKNGEWRLSHQGIAFDSDGIVIDGQHRLTSIAEAGTPQLFMVSEGWNPLNRVVTDKGWMRQLRDDLKIMGVCESPQSVSAILNFIRRHRQHSTVKITYSEAVADLKKYGVGFKFIAGRVSLSRGSHTRGTAVASAFVFAQARAGAVTEKCWNDLQEGAGLASTDPILKLRDECQKPGAFRSSADREIIFRKALNAIYMRLRDRGTKQLKVSDEADAFFAEAYR